jgi:hypothetical protein
VEALTVEALIAAGWLPQEVQQAKGLGWESMSADVDTVEEADAAANCWQPPASTASADSEGQAEGFDCTVWRTPDPHPEFVGTSGGLAFGASLISEETEVARPSPTSPAAAQATANEPLVNEFCNDRDCNLCKLLREDDSACMFL